MPIAFDKTRKRWKYQLRRIVGGRRVRINRSLPRGWSRAEAQAFDDRETPRLLAIAAGIAGDRAVERVPHSIDQAVDLYLAERVPAQMFQRMLKQVSAA